MNGSAVPIGKYAAHLTSFMYAATNTPTCLRRGFCAPIGGQSVWSVVPPASGLSSPTEASEIVMSVASMDSASLFIQRATGAESDMSGLIANLAALNAIANAGIPAANFSRKIIFAFFDAEAWGYGGSQRFLADIANFTCRQFSNDSKVACDRPYYPSLQFQKLDLNKIDTIFEVKQVGLLQSGGSSALFVHQQQHNFSTVAVQTVLAASQSVVNISVAAASSSTPGLPPSSSQSYLKYGLQSKIAVITDHSDQYINKCVAILDFISYPSAHTCRRFYQSRFDNNGNVDTAQICKSAQVLTNSLVLRATGFAVRLFLAPSPRPHSHASFRAPPS
jgi:nicastrin